MITLFSKPGCPPCLQTKACFKERGIEFIEKDVTVDREAYSVVTKQLGYMGVPVVMVDEDTHWVGFDAARINSLT